MKLTGEILAKSLNAIIKDRKIETIKEVMKEAWEEQHKLDIPDWLKPETERFEYHFYNVYLPTVLNSFHFHETYNWALGQSIMIKLTNANKLY